MLTTAASCIIAFILGVLIWNCCIKLEQRKVDRAAAEQMRLDRVARTEALRLDESVVKAVNRSRGMDAVVCKDFLSGERRLS